MEEQLNAHVLVPAAWHSSNTACTMSSHADYSRLKVNNSRYETKIKKDGGAVMAKKSRKLGDAFMAGNLFMCLSIVELTVTRITPRLRIRSKLIAHLHTVTFR